MIAEIEKYLTQIASDKSVHTLRSYKSTLERFCEVCNITSISHISEMTSGDVQDYLYTLKDEGLKATSVNSHARNLTAFFNWMRDNGIPVDIHTKKFTEEKHIADVPTFDEVKNMIATSTGKSKLLITLMAFTGARREEVTNIKVSDIKQGFLAIRQGKGRKDRLIPLHEDLRKMLDSYIAKRDAPDFEYLLYSRRTIGGVGGGEIHKLNAEAIRYSVKAAMLKAGIPEERVACMSAHSMRRFFACFLLKNNVPLGKIQLLLGHSDVKTTMIYLRSAGAEIAEEEVKGLPSLV